MKKYLFVTLLIIVPLTFVHSTRGLSEPDVSIPVFSKSGLMLTVGLGLQADMGPFVAQQTGETTVYTNSFYRIEVVETPYKSGHTVQLRITAISGEPFWMGNLSVSGGVPRGPIQGVWYPAASPSGSNVMAGDGNASISGISEANFGIPYIAGAAGNLSNVFALGLGRQDLSVSITGRPNKNQYSFELRARTGGVAMEFVESFYVSTNPGASWYQTASDYADWVDEISGYEPFPISANAYAPVYDTWYWSEDRVDDRIYMEAARLASEAGFGMFLADSGWDAGTGEYAKWLNGSTGDYTPPPDKFHDLAGTFDVMRTEMNLGVELWLQPFAVGRRSIRYGQTQNLHIHVPKKQSWTATWSGLTYSPFALPLGNDLETVNLCPSASGINTYLRNLFNEMQATYSPQGYWLDFIDGLATYCVAPHSHNYESFGAGFNQTLQTIKSTILSGNPRAIVHFRAQYANLNTKRYANIWQTEDSPGDFDGMRLGSIRRRPFSRGVVFASDQMYWPETTPEVDVAKFIATSVMTGVPAFGPNLAASPQSTTDMLKAWLTFYRRNRRNLTRGTFSPFGQLQVPNHKIEGDTGTYVYLRNLDFGDLAANSNAIYLVNATDGDYFDGRIRGRAGVRTYRVRVLDRYLQPASDWMTRRVNQEGILDLNLAVQQGGMVVVRGIQPQ